MVQLTVMHQVSGMVVASLDVTRNTVPHEYAVKVCWIGYALNLVLTVIVVIVGIPDDNIIASCLCPWCR